MVGMAAVSARADRQHIPLNAMLELTGRCHLDCRHCYLDIKHPPKGELTTGEVIALFDELASAGTMFLTLTGGEVFLRKDIFELLEAAKARRFAIRLFTSGTLLDRDRVARIAEIGPLAVEISIYGLHSDVHDHITRRRGSLRKSLRAAVLLRRAGVPVLLKTPILDGTDDAHFDLIDAARRIGAGYAIDPSLISRRDGGTEPLALRPGIGDLERMYRDQRIAKTPTSLPPPAAPTDAPCAIARRVVRIGPTGDVFACSTFPIPAGNIRERPFVDIWRHSPVLQQLRGITIGDLEGACSGCSRSSYCGRCNAQALLEHGNFRGPSRAACERAEARERALDLPPPPGANAMPPAEPLGRRSIDFVPLTSLRRR